MRAIPISAPAADGTITDVPADSFCTLMGWSVSETAGAVALFHLRVNSATGQIVGTANLAAAGSSTQWFGPDGIHVPGDLYFDKVSGTYSGVIYTA